jgi:hypothetical protein
VLYLLIGTWTLYWGLLAILPFQSTEEAIWEAFLLQLFFVGVVFLSGLATVCSLRGGNPAFQGRSLAIRSSARIAVISLILSIAGLAASSYDKMYVQKVDYSEGVAVARENWKASKTESAGISSAFSALGYLLSPFYFVTAVLLVLKWADFKYRMRVLLLGGVLSVAVAGSALIGGRSSLLLLCSYCISAMALTLPRWRIRARFKKSAVAIAILMLISTATMAFYSIFITAERARMTGVTVDYYVTDFMPFLNVEMSPWFEGYVIEYPLLKYSYPVIFSASYLLHSFSTTAGIISNYDEVDHASPILFGQALVFGSKLGIINAPQDEWMFSGRFPSVPGALFHDYGALGLLIGAVILGIACGISQSMASMRRGSMWLVTIYTTIGSVVILSPYVFAMDLLMGYFIILSFIVASVASSLRLRFKL